MFELVHVQHQYDTYSMSVLHSTNLLFVTLSPGAYINWIQ